MRQKTYRVLRAIVFAAANFSFSSMRIYPDVNFLLHPLEAYHVSGQQQRCVRAASWSLVGCKRTKACAPCTVSLERRIKVRLHSAMARIAAGQPA